MAWTLRFLSTLALVLITTTHAQSPSGGTDSYSDSDSMPARISNWKPIDSDVNPGTFILPNEVDWWRFIPSLLEHRGTFASVGTLRSFFAASVARPSQLVLMDYSAATLDFNRKLLEMIRTSKDLAEFRSKFFGPGFRMDWITEFATARNRGAPINPIGATNLRAILLPKSRGTHEFLFPFNESAFRHFKWLIEEDRIILAKMNIYEPQDWAKLRAKFPGLRIDTIDVSNAVDSSFSNQETRKFLVRELQRMQTERVHFTQYRVRFRQVGFSYHALSLRDFSTLVDSIRSGDLLPENSPSPLSGRILQIKERDETYPHAVLRSEVEERWRSALAARSCEASLQVPLANPK